MRRNVWCALAVPLFLAGCLDSASWNDDSWARVPSPPSSVNSWETVDGNLVHPVSRANVDRAVRLIQDVAILEIPREQAEALVGARLAPVEGTKFYLVRALVLYEEGGGFWLRQSGDSLHVGYGCMGAFPGWMRRRALVVQLRSRAREVYVACGMTT
jgi:hypothetical protein